MTVHKEEAPEKGVPASEFHKNDPLAVFSEWWGRTGPLWGRKVWKAGNAVLAEVEAYREAAADRFTEARVNGVYIDSFGKHQVSVTDFHADSYEDPVGEALVFMDRLTKSYVTEWVVPPRIYLRESITTEWVEWTTY